MAIIQYIQNNEPPLLDGLFSLIRLHSTSALHNHKDDLIARAAQ